MMKRYLFTALVFISTSLFAAIETYEFNNETDRNRFRQLSEELRCPKCQNQNLAGSNSAIAKDLKNELYRMVTAGQSTEQITTFMVERYGDFVLYKPKVNSMTYVLWYGPFALLGFGALVVLLLTRKKKVKTAAKESSKSLEHEQRLKELLDKKND
jgi:cytochrome c-type biogenesis protein CcmH